MDTLRLKRYQKPGSPAGKETNSPEKSAGKKKNFQDKTTSPDKGWMKFGTEFLEYFINDIPLSVLLDHFYDSKTTILENWTGALGTHPKSDLIKIKQLLNKTVTDKEIRQVYPASWTNDEFSGYLDKYRDELANPEILIYCCAECGDYECGGIAVTIVFADKSVIWTINEGDKALKFEFDQYAYFEVLNNYLHKLIK